MAMYVDTKGCKQESDIHNNPGIQYETGLLLMLLGMDKITDQNMDEVMCRFTYYAGITRLSPNAMEVFVRYLRGSVGVKTNNVHETWAKFAKRMADNHLYGWKKDWHDVIEPQA